jgi:hypothetical protein
MQDPVLLTRFIIKNRKSPKGGCISQLATGYLLQ